MSLASLFNSESAGEGRTRKFCGQVSDAGLGACTKVGPMSKVVRGTVYNDNVVRVLGEIVTGSKLDCHAIVRGAVKGIGYDSIADNLGSGG